MAAMIPAAAEDRRSESRAMLAAHRDAGGESPAELLRLSGWSGEGAPTDEQIADAVAYARAHPPQSGSAKVGGATAFGERVDLLSAYERDPPERDDVLVGLEPGNVAAIGAPGGGSKTFFVLGLAHDLAFGGEVASMRTTLVPASKYQRVGILTAEESVTELERRLHAFGIMLDRDQRTHAVEHLDVRSLRCDVPILVERDGSVNFQTRDAVERFSEGKRFIVLDPLGRYCRADKNDDATMVTLVTTLEQIALRVGCVFLLPHHTGKGAILSGNGDSALAMKGSTALVDWCRMALMIFRPPRKVAEERELGDDAWRYRIVKLDKANHREDKGEVWFRVRGDGTLEFAAEQNTWVPPDLLRKVVTSSGGDVNSEITASRAISPRAPSVMSEMLSDDLEDAEDPF